MKISSKSILLLSLLSTTFFTACMQNVVENATESAIENAMEEEGTSANVDLSNGNISISTEEGTYQGGSNAAWPDNFPNDVYQIEGQVTSSMSDLQTGGYWVMVETTATVEESMTLYKDELEKAGWTITGTMNYSGTQSVVAEKDQRQISVMATASGEKTAVTIAEGEL